MSFTQSVDIGDPSNIPNKKFSLETSTRLSGIKTDIVGTVDSIDKQNITLDSLDVIKIYRKRLDSLEWLSTPAQSSFSLSTNLNKRKKGGWVATIQNSPYLLLNINWDNYF